MRSDASTKSEGFPRVEGAEIQRQNGELNTQLAKAVQVSLLF